MINYTETADSEQLDNYFAEVNHYISQLPCISFSTFIKDVIPHLTKEQIISMIQHSKQYTSAVKKVIRKNKDINIRTVMCIYNAIIIPIIKSYDAPEDRAEMQSYYQSKIMRYINILNSKEHHTCIARMPLHHIMPNDYCITDIRGTEPNEVQRLKLQLMQLNKMRDRVLQSIERATYKAITMRGNNNAY